MNTSISTISALSLHKALQEPVEHALLDVREQEEFSRGHMLLASCVSESVFSKDCLPLSKHQAIKIKVLIISSFL